MLVVEESILAVMEGVSHHIYIYIYIYIPEKVHLNNWDCQPCAVYQKLLEQQLYADRKLTQIPNLPSADS
jgi:hypothetical protein